jgi:RNA polymerase sigma-70 factor, ECF subfamily
MTTAARASPPAGRPEIVAGPPPPDPQGRLAAIARAELDFVWRVLRRQGLSRADADDGVQRVFLLLRAKLDGVVRGAEKGFLFRTATYVAKELRRGARRCEEPTDRNIGAAPSPSAQLEAEDLLDKIMRHLDDDERAVFVLFEIEGLTMAEIAPILGCPPGTVASRLRRARESVRAAAASLELQDGGAR